MSYPPGLLQPAVLLPVDMEGDDVYANNHPAALFSAALE
jgi:hypothetical protein